MTDEQVARLFLKPKHPRQVRYEALRARFVDKWPWAWIAKEFGLSEGSLRNLGVQVGKSMPISSLAEDVDLAVARRDARIVALRLKELLSNAEIAQRLKA